MAASPSSPARSSPPSQSPPPPPSSAAAGGPTTWSHVETTQLIDVYREKWYALNRGQLRAHQWEEVAQAVAARCGFDPPSKTATQCRHKIEKLRKRYRSERQRGPASAAAWPYFRPMDLLERGPTAAPNRRSPPSPSPTSSSASSEEDEEEENNNTRSINRILQRPQLLDYSIPRFSRNPRFRKRSFYEERGEEEEEDDDDGDEGGQAEGEEGDRGRPLAELASAIRSFGEGFVRMEKMKMEMMKDAERNRMEMERRRTEMIIDSQRKIADAIRAAILSQKKATHGAEET